MDEFMFVQMWVYGLITMFSLSYMSYHVMDSWALRQYFKSRCFGTFVLAVIISGVTLFAYISTNLTQLADVMRITSVYFSVWAMVIYAIHRFCKIKNLP